MCVNKLCCILGSQKHRISIWEKIARKFKCLSLESQKSRKERVFLVEKTLLCFGRFFVSFFNNANQLLFSKTERMRRISRSIVTEFC